MHEGSCVAERVDVYNPDTVVIEGATVSQGTWLCTATHDFDDPSHPLVLTHSDRRGNLGRREVLWSRVQVGARVFVAVLVKDIQADEVVGGNPAQVFGREAIHEWQH